ncbi:n-acetyllactosaminide beta- -n-acetylglucosaminyltransferase 2 isoform x2 [Limosa lapponica baueri]|uniref:N-acetyllactosaminide beta--n-acetylglucosaminyltransferase 2 isoform x2 n=1 Tax=Limosa lapponica baueri TaxID=1758121 RepID=A0A2I0TCM5_LIMLA|nr:n-acetyllactosaminide beta- -n-acetylglucosaminyltransferase 2 isoform x2 [Limosa lapponica baueri]
MEYFPISSCHHVFRDGSGMFYLPLHADIKSNIWCNWTIWAGPQKHIVIYIQGFQGREGCGKNQDKIIFQGVLSSVETKVVYACHNQGTLIFATQATAVHVLFLSGSGSLSHEYGHFKGWYYVFRDSETVGSSDDTIAPQEPDQEVSKKESWRTVAAKGLLPTVRTSPSPSGVLAGSRIQPELVSPDEETQHPPSLMEDAQSGANLSELDLNECDQLWDETELERSLKDGGTEGRETKDDMLVEPSPAEQSADCKDKLSALEIAKGGVELVSALVTIAPYSSEVFSSNVGLSSKSSSLDQASNSLSEEVVAAAHRTQTPMLEEPPLNTNTKPSPPYPSPGVTAGGVVSPGERDNELFDVLFEVAIEIKAKDWIPHGGRELRKGFLESVKNHIQENLKLSANRVNEIKLREIKRTRDASLLLTFWLHLKPEERNVSLLLHSQLEELLGTSVGVEKLQLVSLLVEDVNECSAGVDLCKEEAECFNGVGTYLCRCKKDYEDHSPTKSGTLCVPVPRSGIGFFLRHADILVGAAIMASLAMLVVATAALCRAARRRWHPRRNPSPEEPPVRAVEEPAMELHDLGECLRLDPFQLKLRARPPEWLWGARAHPGQAYQVFLEQSPQL